MAALLLLVCVPELGSESVSLTTYYPAPSGIYVQIMGSQDAYFATAGGFVGIGTTNPAYKLTTVQANDTIFGLSGDAANSTSFGVGRTAAEARLSIAGAAGDFAANAAAGDAVMRVDSSSKRLHLLAGTGNAMLTLTAAQASIGSTNPSGTTNMSLEVGDGSSVGFIRSRQTGCSVKTACVAGEYEAIQGGFMSYAHSVPLGINRVCCPCGASGCPGSP